MKMCDNASVGVLIYDERGQLLVFERATPPVGIAPPSGHVFDEHGSRDNIDHAYLAAARAEVSEEVGLTVTSLHLVLDRWADNRCGRIAPEQTGHHWRIFAATTIGELDPSRQEARNARWVTPRQLQQLTDRTIDWARGDITDEDFEERPGVEPIWVWWFTSLGSVEADNTDLTRVLALATGTPIP